MADKTSWFEELDALYSGLQAFPGVWKSSIGLELFLSKNFSF